MHTPSDTSCSSPVSRCPSGMRRSFQADFVLLLRELCELMRGTLIKALRARAAEASRMRHVVVTTRSAAKRRRRRYTHTHTHTHAMGDFLAVQFLQRNRFKSARRRRREGGRGESAPIDCDGAVLSQHANALGCARRVAGADSDGGRRTQTGNYGEVSVARWGTLCTTSSLGQSAYSDRTSGRVIISYCFC